MREERGGGRRGDDVRDKGSLYTRIQASIESHLERILARSVTPYLTCPEEEGSVPQRGSEGGSGVGRGRVRGR